MSNPCQIVVFFCEPRIIAAFNVFPRLQFLLDRNNDKRGFRTETLKQTRQFRPSVLKNHQTHHKICCFSFLFFPKHSRLFPNPTATIPCTLCLSFLSTRTDSWLCLLEADGRSNLLSFENFWHLDQVLISKGTLSLNGPRLAYGELNCGTENRTRGQSRDPTGATALTGKRHQLPMVFVEWQQPARISRMLLLEVLRLEWEGSGS